MALLSKIGSYDLAFMQNNKNVAPATFRRRTNKISCRFKEFSKTTKSCLIL